jgi:hypothetical protein
VGSGASDMAIVKVVRRYFVVLCQFFGSYDRRITGSDCDKDADIFSRHGMDVVNTTGSFILGPYLGI